MINLTAQERDRFAAYCRQEAESANMMAGQMRGMPAVVVETVAKKYRTEAMAHAIVGKCLTSGEEMTIEGGG